MLKDMNAMVKHCKAMDIPTIFFDWYNNIKQIHICNSSMKRTIIKRRKKTCSSDRTVKSFFIINYIKFFEYIHTSIQKRRTYQKKLVHIHVCIVYQKLFLSKLAII